MKRILITICTAFILALAGCGQTEDTSTIQTYDAEHEYLNGLEDGQYYIRHKNNTFEPIVSNAITFDYGLRTDNASKSRIMWFKEDFEDIPTYNINDGDALVYYSMSEITEEYTLERFADLGISIGICKIKPTESGKYTVSTDAKKMNTYPESDADEILNFANDTLIIDRVQEANVRNTEELKLNPEQQIDYEKTIKVSEYGTFESLKQNAYYDIDVYEGTKRSVLKLKADVHILGSYELIKKLNYHFTDDYLAEVEIPTDLITGYYNINSMGLFRFIGAGDTYTANTDYNKDILTDAEKRKLKAVDNSNKDEEGYNTTEVNTVVVESDGKSINELRDKVLEEASEGEEATYLPDIKTEALSIENAEGQTIRFIVRLEGDDEIARKNVKATVTHPNGYSIATTQAYNGDLYADIYIDQNGIYTVEIENSGSLKVNVDGEIIDTGEPAEEETDANAELMEQ